MSYRFVVHFGSFFFGLQGFCQGQHGGCGVRGRTLPQSRRRVRGFPMLSSFSLLLEFSVIVVDDSADARHQSGEVTAGSSTTGSPHPPPDALQAVWMRSRSPLKSSGSDAQVAPGSTNTAACDWWWELSFDWKLNSCSCSSADTIPSSAGLHQQDCQPQMH